MTARIRLKEVRKKLKLTQEKLGNSLGLNREGITSLETGKVKISTIFAIALEYIHGINREWLLYGKGDCFIQNEKKLTEVILQHQDIITRFKNPEKGLENNENLIAIEKASEKIYEKVSEYLKTTRQTIDMLQEEKSETKIENKPQGEFAKEKDNT